MTKLLFVVFAAVTIFASPKAEAHFAEYIGVIYPGGGFASYYGFYAGNYWLAPSSEAYYGEIYAAQRWGNGGWGYAPNVAVRGNGDNRGYGGPFYGFMYQGNHSLFMGWRIY